MTVTVITPPAPVLTLDEVKRHLIVEHHDHNALIQAYMQASVDHIDGPRGWLGRAIGPQTLEMRLDRFECDFIRLRCPPVIEVVSIKYDDTASAEQTLDASAYAADPEGVVRLGATPWPSVSGRRGCLRIQYRAGYEKLPPSIRSALLLMIGDFYAFRETAALGVSATQVPMSANVEALLAPYRVWG